MANLRSELEELANEVSASIDHGECFYEYDMLIEFIETLETIKRLSINHFNEIKKEFEDDE